MFLTRDLQARFEGIHPAGACVELPLILLDGQLAALRQIAGSEWRTIGQLIRLTIAHHLTGRCNRCNSHCILGDLRTDSPLNGSGVVEVPLLLPTSRLAELETLAFQSDTTTATLIRGMVCCSLLECRPIQPPMGES